MKFKDVIRKVVSYGGYVISGFLTIAAVETENGEPFALAVGIFTAATFATISLRKSGRERQELELLEMAAIHNGRFTLVEAALELKRPIKKIKKQLQNLENQGAIGYEISDSGELFYKISNTAALQMRHQLNTPEEEEKEKEELWFED